MNEATLKEIITRILSTPELQSLLATSSERQNAKPSCLILLNDQEGVEQLAALEERYRRDYSVSVCVGDAVALAGQKENRISYEQALQEARWERLHIPVCSKEQLAQIAQGLCNDQTSKLVAVAITSGIPVEIGRVTWGFTAKTPEKYQQMFERYVQQVAEFGVVIIDNYFAAQQPVVVSALGDVSPSSQVLCKQQMNAELRYEKKLLSDKEAARLPSNVVLRIAKSTVITPAGIDVLKKQKVEVYREGVRYF